MGLITALGLEKYYAANPILIDVTCALRQGDKVGLIGRNGSGKTTLLRLLSGLEDYDAGSIRVQGSTRLGYLTQGVELDAHLTVWQAVVSALEALALLEQKLRQIEKRMGEAEILGDPHKLAAVMAAYTKYNQEFERLGGYEREIEARSALTGLGLAEDTWEQNVANLSGGQKTRVALAKLLLSQPDVLLLDEPTNHLDIEAIDWLEEFLSRYKGALLAVSHDRQFLDQVTTKIWELDGGQLREFSGNYSAYIMQKAADEKSKLLLYEKQEKQRRQLEALIAKFKAGTRATAAKNWQKRLARTEGIFLTRPQKNLKLSLDSGRRSGNDVLSIENLSKAYAQPLFHNFSAEVKQGERIALLGPNGSGKTTLLKILLGDVDACRGQLKWGASIDLGYFSQDLNLPDEDLSVLDSLLAGGKVLPGEARNHLARFLFVGDDVFQPARTLSGGERNRLVLAKLLLAKANVLILDEPTNHLDIPAREALEEALLEYDGTLFIVSHDRYFLRHMVTRLWHFDRGEIVDYKMGYGEFLQEIAQKQEQAPAAVKKRTGVGPAVKKVPSIKQMRVTLSSLEEQIANLENEHGALWEELADPQTYAEGAGQEAALRLRELEKELQILYENWERQGHALEKAKEKDDENS